MAHSFAIAAIGQVICAQLDAAFGAWRADHPQDQGFDTLRCVLIGSDTLARSPPTDTALTLYLYRVGLSSSTRNLPPRTTSDGRTLRPALPLELHYLLTAWARDPVLQQRILGLAIRALEDQPTLPAALLNRVGVSGADTLFRDEESVELCAAPLSQAELVSIWEVNKASMQPSMPYIVRGLRLDSDQLVAVGAPVVERRFGGGT